MNSKYIVNSNRIFIQPIDSSVFKLFVATMVLFLPVHAANAEEGYVQVRNASLRQGPKAWAPLVAALKYGTAVEIVNDDDDNWWQVKTAANKTGYLHQSSLTSKKILFSDAKTSFDGSAESVDLVLAGKGFTSDIEKEYSKSNVELNYTAVDRLEKRTVSESEMQRFRKEGGLE